MIRAALAAALLTAWFDVVKSHGPSCTTAIKGVKGFMAHHTSPRYYKCKSYGADIPAYCIGAIEKYKRRYFFASKG